MFTVQAHQNNQINLTFDYLFPQTWYQKSLEELIYVWHMLANGSKNPGVVIEQDRLLAKLAYAEFFVNRLVAKGEVCLLEDKDYFCAVLRKIKELVGVVTEDEEFIGCVGEMVDRAEGKILSF